MDSGIVEQGLELMLYGMGTVVVFLTLLILITVAMSWVVQRYFPEEVEVPIINSGHSSKDFLGSQHQAPPIAVITAAIHQHRANKN